MRGGLPAARQAAGWLRLEDGPGTSTSWLPSGAPHSAVTCTLCGPAREQRPYHSVPHDPEGYHGHQPVKSCSSRRGNPPVTRPSRRPEHAHNTARRSLLRRRVPIPVPHQDQRHRYLRAAAGRTIHRTNNSPRLRPYANKIEGEVLVDASAFRLPLLRLGPILAARACWSDLAEGPFKTPGTDLRRAQRTQKWITSVLRTSRRGDRCSITSGVLPLAHGVQLNGGA